MESGLSSPALRPLIYILLVGLGVSAKLQKENTPSSSRFSFGSGAIPLLINYRN